MRTPDLSEEEISAYLIVKFGARVFHVLREPASRVTQQFKTHRVMIIKEAYPQLTRVDDLENAILLDDKLTGKESTESAHCFRCFGPPTNTYRDCGRELQLHNEPIDVTFFSLKCSLLGKKISLRSSHCKTNYNYATYEKKESGYKFNEESRQAVESSDQTLVDRDVFELYCSFARVSFDTPTVQ